MEPVFVEAKSSPTLVAMLYLAEKYGWDKDLAVILHQKYGDDVLMFFYMFAGQRVRMPSFSRLASLAEKCKFVHTILLNGFSYIGPKEMDIYRKVKPLFNEAEEIFKFEVTLHDPEEECDSDLSDDPREDGIPPESDGDF